MASKALTQPIVRGWLQKRSRHMKQWRKRWVILQEFGIYTFKTETNIISQATEIIDLHTALYVKPCSDLEASASSSSSSSSSSPSPSSLTPFCFEVYCNNVTFILKAESRQSMVKWVKYIEQQLFKTYLNTNSSSIDTVNSMAKRGQKNEKLWVCTVCA